MKLIAQSASADGTSGSPNLFICAQQPAVELEAELVAAVGEQDDVDVERAEEVADHGADRALVRADDERDRRADRDQDVRDARDRELHGPLLDPEERRHLRVVHLRPEPDEAGADEPRVAVPDPVRGGPSSGRDAASPRSARRRRSRATSPSVAIPIVNQNEVRTTSVRRASSSESK